MSPAKKKKKKAKKKKAAARSRFLAAEAELGIVDLAAEAEAEGLDPNDELVPDPEPAPEPEKAPEPEEPPKEDPPEESPAAKASSSGAPDPEDVDCEYEGPCGERVYKLKKESKGKYGGRRKVIVPHQPNA